MTCIAKQQSRKRKGGTAHMLGNDQIMPRLLCTKRVNDFRLCFVLQEEFRMFALTWPPSGLIASESYGESPLVSALELLVLNLLK